MTTKWRDVAAGNDSRLGPARDDAWARFDDHDEVRLVGASRHWQRSFRPTNAAALFERACAQDSTGHSDLRCRLRRALAISGVRHTAPTSRDPDVAFAGNSGCQESVETADTAGARWLRRTGRTRLGHARADGSVRGGAGQGRRWRCRRWHRHLVRYQRSMAELRGMLVESDEGAN